MKKCTKCKCAKDEKDFAKLGGGKIRSRCNVCQSSYYKDWLHKTGRCKTYAGQPRKDLLGVRVGRLIVIEHLGIEIIHDASVRFWLCRCDCGNTVKLRNHQITGKRTKSCGCLQNRKGSDNPLWGGYGEISGNFWDCIRRKRNSPRISAQGRSFEITIEQAWDLFIQQDRKCALSGVELVMPTTKNKATASLDRIDSNEGYVLDNVQWVHKDINRMKNVYSQEYFIEMCKKVAAKN